MTRPRATVRGKGRKTGVAGVATKRRGNVQLGAFLLQTTAFVFGCQPKAKRASPKKRTRKRPSIRRC